MSVVRRDKRTVRRVRPRRVGTGMVALLALGTGAGCGQALLRPNIGPGIAAESLGQADMAIPSRGLAWVGSDGRRDLPMTAAIPPREPDRLNVGLEPAVVASSTTWNGWKVPSGKGRSAEPPAPPASLSLMEGTAPFVAISPDSAIPMPSTRLSGNSSEVETLLAASRDTKIAPPLKHRTARPEIPVAQAPPPPPITVADVLPAPAAEPPIPMAKTEQPIASIAEVAPSTGPTINTVEVDSSKASVPEGTASAAAVVADSSPIPAPNEPSGEPVESALAVTVTKAVAPVADRDADKPVAMAPLDPVPKPVIIASGVVDAPANGLPAGEPEVATPSSPAELDPLASAAEMTGIPLPKRPGVADVSPVSASEPTSAALIEEAVADVSQGTDIPMPASVIATIPAPSVPDIAHIPMPNPPVEVNDGTTSIPMPVPRVTVHLEDSVVLASRTTHIPMPIPPVGTSAPGPLTVDYGTTNIPMPVPHAPASAPEEDPLVTASRTTNIPMPIPVATLKEDPLSEASRTTNIPLPVPVSKPEPVGDPLIEASRATRIPLPIPASDKE